MVAWDLRQRPPHVQSTLPHPSIHLVFESGQARVVGVHRGRFTQTLEGCSSVFGVKFRPGGFYAFWPSPMNTLTNQTVAAATLLGPDVERLAATGSAATKFQAHPAFADEIDRVSAWLRTRQPAPHPDATRAAAIVAHILDNRAITQVQQLTSSTGLTVRQLQRLFNRYVGVGPKWVIQRYRLHEALDRVAAGVAVDWAELAADLGYFDQAHFIRDFKSLVGQTPAAYQAGP